MMLRFRSQRRLFMKMFKSSQRNVLVLETKLDLDLDLRRSMLCGAVASVLGWRGVEGVCRCSSASVSRMKQFWSDGVG